MTRMATGELALPRDHDWNKARPLTALLESVVDGAGRKAVIDVDSISMRISKFANAGVRVEAGARGSFGPATLTVPGDSPRALCRD